MRKETRSGGGRKWHTLATALHRETSAYLRIPTEDPPERVPRKQAVLRPAHLPASLVPNSVLRRVSGGAKQFALPSAVAEMGLECCLEPCPLSLVLDCLRLVLERASRAEGSGGGGGRSGGGGRAGAQYGADRGGGAPRGGHVVDADDEDGEEVAGVGEGEGAVLGEGEALVRGSRARLTKTQPKHTPGTALGVTKAKAASSSASSWDDDTVEAYVENPRKAAAAAAAARSRQLGLAQLQKVKEQKRRGGRVLDDDVEGAPLDTALAAPPAGKDAPDTARSEEEVFVAVWRFLAAEYAACQRLGTQARHAPLRLLITALIGAVPVAALVAREAAREAAAAAAANPFERRRCARSRSRSRSRAARCARSAHARDRLSHGR